MADLDVVICTYDNEAMLDRVLSALAGQTAPSTDWSVLVVDNNSASATRQVLEGHLATGSVPGLRVVRETTQGLTPARRRGVAETRAPWVAFVDDDCLLDPRWVEEALAFARSHPDSGGFGGRVVPTYEESPPATLAERGWLFAEQDLGDDLQEVDCLVGAGMVLNRDALEQSGWTGTSYFADRIGRRLVSGGDVEIALRVAGTGRPLWYVPACHLDHVVPPSRTDPAYLARLARGLGSSALLAHVLTWHGSRRAWARGSAREAVRSLRRTAGAMRTAVRRPADRSDALLTAAYEWGWWLGLVRVAGPVLAGRCRYFGGDRALRPT